jgi:RNA polymerase sigma factor FliA
MSAGLFGLMDAIDAFDLERGVKFETYCAPRIRGAILDELRSMDWVPRLVRHRTAKVDVGRPQDRDALGRKPTSEEIAKLGSAMRTSSRRSSGRQAVGPSASPASGSRPTQATSEIRENRRRSRRHPLLRAETTPSREIQRKDLKDLITKGLSRAERLIVILYYYEG